MENEYMYQSYLTASRYTHIKLQKTGQSKYNTLNTVSRLYLKKVPTF